MEKRKFAFSREHRLLGLQPPEARRETHPENEAEATPESGMDETMRQIRSTIDRHPESVHASASDLPARLQTNVPQIFSVQGLMTMSFNGEQTTLVTSGTNLDLPWAKIQRSGNIVIITPRVPGTLAFITRDGTIERTVGLPSLRRRREEYRP